MNEYKKSLEDEIDWKIIDQLHNATAKFSSASLEFKKIYFTILGISTPVIFKLSGDTFDIALLLSPLVISAFFWFLDSFTYFYQEKLREKMDKHFEILKERNLVKSDIAEKKQTDENHEEYTLENKRKKENRLFRSIINPSSAFYPILIILNIILIICHYAGCF